jgi:hypothetical protein
MAQDRLANLVDGGKIAARRRIPPAGRRASPEETAQLAELLRRQVLPVPRDLNDMLLAEIGG